MSNPIEEAECRLIETTNDVSDFMRWLGQSRSVLAFDVETGGLSYHKNPLRLIQFGDADGGWAMRWDRWSGVALEALTKYEGQMAAHNASFDIHFIEYNSDIKIPWGQVNDTMLMSKVLSPNTSAALKTCSAKLISKDAKRAQGALASAMKEQKWGWNDIPYDFDLYWGYGIVDTILTARLYDEFLPQVESEFEEVYTLERSVSRICNGMERRGVAIDLPYCERMYEEIIKFTQDVEQYCVETWGVRPSESQKVAEVLRKEGVDLTQLTETGKWAMDKVTLGEVRHPLAELVMQHRQKTKVGSAYFQNFLEMHHNGRLHCSIRTMAARTGRMSITDPALQTIPRGTVVRDAFLPNEGETFNSIDYSGIEARLFAHFANEEGLIKVFHEGFDPHTYTAQQVFNVEIPTKAQRQVAKNCTFCMLFGGGVDKMAWTGGITVEEADAFLQAYKKRFPQVPVFMKTVEATAKHRFKTEGRSYVKTPLGRLQVGDKGKDYALVNALIQGSAADVMKKALINIDNAGYGEHLLLAIHDEALFSLPSEINLNDIKDVMEDHTSFRVPLVCEASGGFDCWGDKSRQE